MNGFSFWLLLERGRKKGGSVEMASSFSIAAMRPNVWPRQSCFLMWNCSFEYEHPFVNKKVAITEPAVISARLLRLVSNGIVSTCKACSTFSNLNSSSKEMKGYARRVGNHSQRRHWQPNELWVLFLLSIQSTLAWIPGYHGYPYNTCGQPLNHRGKLQIFD